MKLWDKGIAIDKLTENFTTGKDQQLDIKLAAYDVIGSIAHVRMLYSIGIITEKEMASLERELKRIYGIIKAGDFHIETNVEDVHSQLEIMLTNALGETGKKVHTARSRNDQVLLDLKLFTRDKLKEIVIKAEKLFNTLINLSEKHKEILMPGYTHMQIAMPSSFGLWFGAYAESLADDMILIKAAYDITNQNPLGSAAGYGSSFPVNRSMTTDLLGFKTMHVNVVNSQMNRGKMEQTVAFAIGSIGSTLSKMAMDVCIYSGLNYGFFNLPDEFTTGSSIMPHKKNPDVFELIRASGNKLRALPVEIAMINSNLPSGYHRDFQLVKESFIPSFDLLIELLTITDLIIDRITVNPDIISKGIYQDMFSVEEVNKIVNQGVPFREAYKMVAGKRADKISHTFKFSDHTHEGSMGNLCNDLIRTKMNSVISGIDFNHADEAIKKLLS